MLIDKLNPFLYFFTMLTKEQLAQYEEQLIEEKEKLALALSHQNPNVDFGDDVDAGDEEADETEAFATVLGVKQVEKEHLLDVEHALDKIKKGTYGKCEHCEEPITADVLAVEPESRLCKSCKALV